MVKEWHIYLLIGWKWWGHQLIATSVVGSFFFFLNWLLSILILLQCIIIFIYFMCFSIDLFSSSFFTPTTLSATLPFWTSTNVGNWWTWSAWDTSCYHLYQELKSVLKWWKSIITKKKNIIYILCMLHEECWQIIIFFLRHSFEHIKIYWIWQNFVSFTLYLIILLWFCIFQL